MNFATKLIVAIITISATIVGSIWTGFETLDGRMDDKVKEGKAEVITLMTNMKQARDMEIKLRDENLRVEIVAIKDGMSEIKEDIRGLYRIGKSIDRKVTLQNREEVPYTLTYKTGDKNEGERSNSDVQAQ